MEVIHPKREHLKVLEHLSMEHGLAKSFNAMASTVRLTSKERKMLKDVSDHKRMVSEPMTIMIENSGMVTKTNLAYRGCHAPSHYMLTEFGLLCYRSVKLMEGYSIPPLNITHNNQMVDFLKEFEEMCKELPDVCH